MESNEMPEVSTDLTRVEFEAAVASGVRKALRDIGINYTEEQIFEIRKDFEFLREWRKSCESMKSRGFLLTFTILVLTAISLITVGVREWIIRVVHG